MTVTIEISMTEKQFRSNMNVWTVQEIINFLSSHGVTFRPDPPILDGVYRRLNGRDMIQHRQGVFTAFPVDGFKASSHICWASSYGNDTWVRVLDESLMPVTPHTAFEFTVNGQGERV